MTKTTTLFPQGNGLYTVTTVETTIEKDVPLILDKPEPIPTPTPSQPILWKRATDFFSLSIGSSAIQPNGITEAFINTKVTTSPDGRKCAEMGIVAGDTGYGDWGGIITHPKKLVEGNEVTFKIDTFFPTGFDFRADPRLKFLRVHTGSSAIPNEGYLDLYILPQGGFSHDSEVIGISTNRVPFGKPIVPGVWETYEVHVKFSATPGKGFYKVRQNGVLIYENLTQKTLRSTQSYSDASYIFTYWNKGAPKDQNMYINNVSLTAK